MLQFNNYIRFGHPPVGHTGGGGGGTGTDFRHERHILSGVWPHVVRFGHPPAGHSGGTPPTGTDFRHERHILSGVWPHTVRFGHPPVGTSGVQPGAVVVGGRQIWPEELDDLTLATHKWHQRLIDAAKPGQTGEEIRKIAQKLGSLGGKARAEAMTSKQRTQQASKAAQVRWQR